MKTLKEITVLCPHGHITKPKVIQIPINTSDTVKILKDNCFFDRADLLFACKKCNCFYKAPFILIDNEVKAAKRDGKEKIQLKPRKVKDE